MTTATATVPSSPLGAPSSAKSRPPAEPLRTRAGVQDRGIVSVERHLMGGRVGIHLQPGSAPGAAVEDAHRMLGRIAAWADLLTRFSPTSDLSRLNADPTDWAAVRPTLGAVLDWGRAAESMTDGIVDIAMLDARLAAETPDAATGHGSGTWTASHAGAASRRWSLARGVRYTHVHRPAGLRFDLDGVAKGWLADRAVDRLAGHRAAVVDADGDVAVRLTPETSWRIGIEDPGRVGLDLLVLHLSGLPGREVTRYGVATSGTSIHRWDHGGRVAHHLLDPRTGQPAATDVVQATVVAGSARQAEALAKTAVILGSPAALGILARPDVQAAVLLTDRGELLLAPGTMRFIA